MAESSPTTGARPVSAPAYEPFVRLNSPMPAGGTAPARANHPVLLPEADLDDELPRPTRRPRWYEPLAKPAAYIAAGLAGALLVTALSVVMGARFGSPRANRVVVDSAPDPQLQLMSAATLDRRADSLALALAAFSLRVSMYDTRRMGCAGLARGLQQVEDGWLAYNVARKATLALNDSGREARDQSLYADVRAVELRFERSPCTRP
ncbi:MAG: hypothetical protein AUI08_01720 [Gemmatimonadetes bacterium 13_2_20CM_2_65_7]|nr:MAG: hypothetical protein AUI08_01720 [Gemmatimonadetes bacterium 13_2_20CM_2_65_7]